MNNAELIIFVMKNVNQLCLCKLYYVAAFCIFVWKYLLLILNDLLYIFVKKNLNKSLLNFLKKQIALTVSWNW